MNGDELDLELGRGDDPAGVSVGVGPGGGRLTPPHKYSLVIQWSEEDRLYLVTLPEWEGHFSIWQTAAHGATYEEAARNGQEVLKMLVKVAREKGRSYPSHASRTRPASEE